MPAVKQRVLKLLGGFRPKTLRLVDQDRTKKKWMMHILRHHPFLFRFEYYQCPSSHAILGTAENFLPPAATNYVPIYIKRFSTHVNPRYGKKQKNQAILKYKRLH